MSDDDTPLFLKLVVVFACGLQFGSCLGDGRLEKACAEFKCADGAPAIVSEARCRCLGKPVAP